MRKNHLFMLILLISVTIQTIGAEYNKYLEPGKSTTCLVNYTPSPDETNIYVDWDVIGAGTVFEIEFFSNPLVAKVFTLKTEDVAPSYGNYSCRLVATVFENGVLVKTQTFTVSVRYVDNTPSDEDPYDENNDPKYDGPPVVIPQHQ